MFLLEKGIGEGGGGYLWLCDFSNSVDAIDEKMGFSYVGIGEGGGVTCG